MKANNQPEQPKLLQYENNGQEEETKNDQKNEELNECSSSDSSENETEYQIGENVDCQDIAKKWINAEIISIRNNEARVHYTNWLPAFDEWIDMTSNRIQKQWRKGQELRINNRIDALDENNEWLEARIIDKDANQMVKVHYFNFSPKYDEWMQPDSDRIQEVGSHSKAFGRAKAKLLKQHNQSNNLNAQQLEFIKKLHAMEHQYKKDLKTRGLYIHETVGDGNCLFRAISDQLYGDQCYFKAIRRICMDYICIERNFFKNFIVGGDQKFDQYIQRKRKNGVWGDDVEIQAISEIYNRPIEIYAYSITPMRTFHEKQDQELIVNKQINPQQFQILEQEKQLQTNLSPQKQAPQTYVKPIRLNYQGHSHYNSIRNTETTNIINGKFGVIEDAALKEAKQRNLQAKNQQLIEVQNSENKQNTEAQSIANQETQSIQGSRMQFETNGKRDMDTLLEESLQQFEQFEQQKVEEAKKFSLDLYNEQQLLELAIKESNQNNNNIKELSVEEQLLKQVMEESQKENQMNFKQNCQFQNDLVRQIVEMGYPPVLVQQAYALIGDNKEEIIRMCNENL